MTFEEAIEILGIDLSKVISKAYKEKAKQFHPDAGGSHEKMIQLNEAVNVLRNRINNSDYEQISKIMSEFVKQMNEFYSGIDKINKIFEEKEQKRDKYWNTISEINHEVWKQKSKFKNESDFYEYVGNELLKIGYNNIAYDNFLDANINKYYAILKKFNMIYIDSNTYQARYSKKKDGSKVGPYYYRVWKENGKFRQKYVGKELPESALGELTVGIRKKKCLGIAINYANEIFG
ncbi:MAG: hypothetical protein K6T88_06415 [Bacillus sp. (in: Bacteria)]|nr:hypothetical protein [Bacillus sp. (in: firmicutes)]